VSKGKVSGKSAPKQKAPKKQQGGKQPQTSK